jgi:hypothetical protein
VRKPQQSEGQLRELTEVVPVRQLYNTPVRVLEHGGMMRKGKTGASREDGMTDEIAQQVRAVGSKILRDEAALSWIYGGGAVV